MPNEDGTGRLGKGKDCDEKAKADRVGGAGRGRGRGRGRGNGRGAGRKLKGFSEKTYANGSTEVPEFEDK